MTARIFAKGNFIAPTVFADVTNDMSIAQEEIFGPVLCVEKFSTEEEALNCVTEMWNRILSE